MFCWGANSHGQLGLGFSSELCETPQQVESIPFGLQQLTAVAAGGGHTLVSTTEGDLYATGWNNRGQLGLDHTEDVCRFTLAGKFRFKSILCGWDVSGAVSGEGDVYLWGSNVWLQVSDSGVKYLPVPTKLTLPGDRRARKICFGLRHTCILTEDGSLLLLGKSKWLQKEELKPTLVRGVHFYEMKFSEQIMDIASGENHLVILLGRSSIVCIGDNKFGQCPREVELNPHQLEVVKLDSGWSHSGYLTNNGRAYLWGRNNYGQLGVATKTDGNEPVVVQLDVESEVLKFCLGSQHGIALAADGLYTWGWNEHGNCGTGGVDNVMTPTRIEGMTGVYDIAAGAGFCWALQKM